MPDPPGTQWLRTQTQQIQAPPKAPTTWPSVDFSDPKYDNITNNYETGEMISPIEDAIDAHIAKQKMNKDDIFSVLHSDGNLHYYKYLGPNSGGRKDWMEVAPPKGGQGIPMS